MEEKIKKINKLSFSYKRILLGILDNNEEPFTKLLLNFKEVNEILNKKESNIFKYFYFNRKKIHQILYDNEKILNIDSIEMGINLSSFFYLSLLIKDSPDFVNYSYSIKFIKKINDLQKNNNNKNYKKLILSKIILELINNYKQIDRDEEEEDDNDEEAEEEDLNNLLKYNNDIIKENINALNEIDLKIDKDNFINKNIDEIYLEIIKSLIFSQKFDNYNYIYNIMIELDLENINITKIIFDGISKTLNNENDKKYYMISNINEIFDEKKINFYYILLKYLLKNSIYIYQIPILLQ